MGTNCEGHGSQPKYLTNIEKYLWYFWTALGVAGFLTWNFPNFPKVLVRSDPKVLPLPV